MKDRFCSVAAATFTYRHEAEFARGFLVNQGIPAAVTVDDAGGMYGGIAFGADAARVLVRPEHLKDARKVLETAGMMDSEESGEESRAVDPGEDGSS